MKSLGTPLGRVRGLGSANEGTHHWWLERMTSAALVPLTLWFIVSMVTAIHYDYAQLSTWIARPLNSALLVLFVVVMFHHAILGMEVVIEDYVHHDGVRLTALVGTKFLLIPCAVIGVIAVLRIAIGG